MEIWRTRVQSNIWLQNELAKEAEIIGRGFELINNCVTVLGRIGRDEGETLTGKFSRIGAITLAKSSHYLLGCYSLAIDGLSQESGAILRPLIETYELLVYLCLDPNRVEEVINGKLPSAGKIAQKISGNFKDLRKHLNDSASHFSYKIDSVRHLIDINQEVSIKTFPTQSIGVFKKNLNVLNAFQTFILFEAANCMFAIGFEAENISSKIEIFRDRSIKVFSENDET